MTKYEANRLLDRHKETKEFSYLDTTRMLSITGDIEEHRSEGVDSEAQEEAIRPWDNECFRMVATNLIRHTAKAWSTSS
jgi:hypothetical protein